jgi:quinoprotein dehydrogenase-associated probable ABC transporter substrate-binding protein
MPGFFLNKNGIGNVLQIPISNKEERMIKLQKWAILASALLGASFAVNAEDLKPIQGQEVLRVCADPNNMPYSNKNKEGFDNKIAELLGEKLGIPVEYYWFPQRIGFSRNTIKKEHPERGGYMCDLAMSVPEHTDFLLPTKPYFSSIEAIAYRSGEGYEITKLSDLKEVNEKHGPLKIGLFDRAISTKALIDMGLGENIVYYQLMSGDVNESPGRAIEDLAAGKIDVIPMWGPIAGYYAKVSDVPITLNELGQLHVFSFSMATRYSNRDWNKLLNKFIDQNKDEIDAIIAEYNLPSLENVSPTPAKRPRKDDDD